MEKVRAKFSCLAVKKSEDGQSEHVEMRPVTNGSEENESFSKFTPSGLLQLDITNENLFGAFEEGKEYYLDISEAQ